MSRHIPSQIIPHPNGYVGTNAVHAARGAGAKDIQIPMRYWRYLGSMFRYFQGCWASWAAFPRAEARWELTASICSSSIHPCIRRVGECLGTPIRSSPVFNRASARNIDASSSSRFHYISRTTTALPNSRRPGRRISHQSRALSIAVTLFALSRSARPPAGAALLPPSELAAAQRATPHLRHVFQKEGPLEGPSPCSALFLPRLCSLPVCPANANSSRSSSLAIAVSARPA